MFLFSKLLSAIAQPMFWLALRWALALLILIRWRRPAVVMLGSGLMAFGLLGFRAIPDALLRPLEAAIPFRRPTSSTGGHFEKRRIFEKDGD